MRIQLSHDIKFTIFASIFVLFSLFKVYQSPPGILLSISIIIFAYFYTDIISGLLHLILDDENSLNLPLIKPLAEGFQRHHEKPNSIYEMSLYSHLYVMHLPLTIAYPLVLLFNTPTHHSLYLAIAFMLHFMQMSHRWAHLPKTSVSPQLRLLQDGYIVIGPSEHGIHHKSPFDTNFCIMNGWFNPGLNQIVKHFKISLNAWILVFLTICILPLFIASIGNHYL